MDKKRHGLQISGRMKLRHHHSERRQQTMSEKIAQLNEEAINGQIINVKLIPKSWTKVMRQSNF